MAAKKSGWCNATGWTLTHMGWILINRNRRVWQINRHPPSFSLTDYHVAKFIHSLPMCNFPFFLSCPSFFSLSLPWVCVCVCSVAWACPMLCDPMDCSPPGSSVYGIFQARMLERVAISSSRGPSRPGDRSCVSSCISCIGRQILYYWATWEEFLSVLCPHI